MRGAPPLFAIKLTAIIRSCGPDGATFRDCCDATGHYQQVSKCLRRLVKRGELFVVGKPMWKRYFDRNDWADAYALIEPEIAAARRNSQHNKKRERDNAYKRANTVAKQLAKPKPYTPVTIAPVSLGKAKVVGMESAPRIVGRAWTHDVRFQVPPGSLVAGPFTSIGIGRYLDE